MIDKPTLDQKHWGVNISNIVSHERRKSPRHDTTLFVCSADGLDNWRLSRGNVSANGFFIKGLQHSQPVDLLVGNKLNILFRLPGAGFWLQAVGIIIGSEQEKDSFDLRGRFTKVDLGDLDVLEDWISSVQRLS